MPASNRFLALFVVLALTGCQSSGTVPASQGSPSSAEPPRGDTPRTTPGAPRAGRTSGSGARADSGLVAGEGASGAGSAADAGMMSGAAGTGASGASAASVDVGRPNGGEAGASAGTAGMMDSLAAGSGEAPSADAAAAGSGAAAGAAALAPTFEQTRCIDPSKLEPGVEVSFPCDGVDLWVALPPQCESRSCGLIFNIHGGGMTDHATMDQATDMIALGGAANYVVVHPHKGTWNVASDKDAMFDFLQQAITAFGIDPKRVHATGYSQGGQLSWALACEHADIVASVAPAEEINRVTDCWKPSALPAREIPILFAYGKRDSIGGGYDAATMLASDVAAAWQMMGPETIAGSEGSTYWRQRWTSSAGNVFEFISHDYTSTGVGGILAGHCLPMADGTTFVSCSAPVDYDWGREVVQFFQEHPLE